MPDIEEEKRAAKRAALSDSTLYHQATQKYGGYLKSYRGHIPRALSIAHVLRVNRALDDAPLVVGRSFRRGFLMAGTNVAGYSDFSASDLDRPDIAAYVWCREVNRMALALYNGNKSYFPNSRADFWKTAYLKHTLGDRAFDRVWNSASGLTANNIHPTLVYTVNELKKAVPPWNVTTIKKLVEFDCEYVFALTENRGTLNSEGYGKTPTLNKQAILSNG